MTAPAGVLPERRLRSPLPVAVAGTGLHLPETVVTNRELAALLDTSDEWIVARTGIRERRWLAPELAVSDMAIAAADRALAAAGRTAADLGLVVVASYTPDQPLPSTALVVADAIGAHHALPLDLTQAACANGVQALLVAAHLMQTSTAGAALVVAADCASRVTDPHDRTTRVFFGDAAAAVVLVRADTAGAVDGGPDGGPGVGLLSWDFGAELSTSVRIPGGGSRLPASPTTVAAGQHYLRMDGRAVWETATTRLPHSIRAAVSRAGLAVGDLTHFLLHQANLHIVTAAMDSLGVPRERAPITVDLLGNTGSAGAFTALHRVVEHGLLRPGDTYVVSAIGAGFQWGTLCFRHG